MANAVATANAGNVNEKLHAACAGSAPVDGQPGTVIADVLVDFAHVAGGDYIVGGVPVDLSAFCPNKVQAVAIQPATNGAVALLALYVPAPAGAPATGVIKLFVAADTEETAIDISAYTVRMTVFGS